MKEDRLQYECVSWFRKEYPAYANNIVMIHNETDKGAHYASIGLCKGASDLMIINGTYMLFPELKVEGSRHNVSHLKTQLKWLSDRQWESKFHGAGFFSTVDRFKIVVNLFMNDDNKWKEMCTKSLITTGLIIASAEEKGTKTTKVELEKHYE